MAPEGAPVVFCENDIHTRGLVRPIIDALRRHIAVIDNSGKILVVNSAWRQFAAANGAEPDAVSEGRNYLEVCDRAALSGNADAAEVSRLIAEVASGKTATASTDYPCGPPTDEGWFSVSITRLASPGPIRIIIEHENVTDRARSARRIEYLATHDGLTGLPNRSLLADRMREAREYADVTGRGMALLFFDLDNFKYLNDAFGHAFGDAILASFAREICALTRIHDTVARIGGDEFVVLLPDLGDAALEAEKVASGLVRHFESPLQIRDREVFVAPSIGISLYPRDASSLDELLTHADEAMYRAKKEGGGAFHFYSADMSARAAERLLVESELRRALRRGQFELYYQPQVLIATNEMVGMEALIRWSHPELGMVPPDRFIPIAEETGLIGPIGRAVLRSACVQNRAWERAGYSVVPVAVNVSTLELSHPNFVTTVKEVLLETGLDPRLLELEITERMMMEKSAPAVERLRELKSIGVGLSIDDFGTGYSNLSCLKTFPFDRLKIDRSFVEGIPHDPDAKSIIRAVIALGDNLGLGVIAEGVETAAQAAYLASIGCKEAQGFFYGLPLTVSEMASRLRGSSGSTNIDQLG